MSSRGRTAGASDPDARDPPRSRLPKRGTRKRQTSSKSCAYACATPCGLIVSDVPVGVLLSGGSTPPCSLPSQQRKWPSHCGRSRSASRRGASTKPADARLKRYGTKHRELGAPSRRCPPPPSLRGRIRRAVQGFLGPADLPRLAARRRGRMLRREGGDELFGGYYTHAADLLAERAGWAAPLLRPLADRLPRAPPRERASTSGKALALRTCRHSSGIMAEQICSPEVRRAGPQRRSTFDPVDLLRARFDETEGAERLRDCRTWTSAPTSSTTYWSRPTAPRWRTRSKPAVPFLDPVVTNFARALPTRHKVRGLRKKIPPRKAAAPLVLSELFAVGSAASDSCRCSRSEASSSPFARDTLGRCAPPAGPPPRGGRRADRRPRRRTRRLEPPALGIARLHAPGRAARRAHAGRSAEPRLEVLAK